MSEEERKQRHRENARKWRAEHPEKVKAAQLKYQETHPIECKESRKKYYDSHRQERIAYSQRYRAEHPDEVKAKRKIYVNDPEVRAKFAAYRREYRAKNIDKLTEYQREYDAARKNSKHEQYIKHSNEIRRDYIEKGIQLWEDAITFFGPCECCGEHRFEFLSVDHKNGGGNKRRINGEKIGRRLLREFELAGWPENLKKEYRLLCYNCNMAIGHRGYCPHQVERDEAAKFESKTKGLPS